MEITRQPNGAALDLQEDHVAVRSLVALAELNRSLRNRFRNAVLRLFLLAFYPLAAASFFELTLNDSAGEDAAAVLILVCSLLSPIRC